MRRSGDRVIARDRVIGNTGSTAFSAYPRLSAEALSRGFRFSLPLLPITGSPDHRITRSPFHLPSRLLGLAQDDSGGGNRFPKIFLPTSSVAQRVARRALDVCQVLLTTLREIFDESAYTRFLANTHATRSVESYRAFLLEREAVTVGRPRCC